MVIRPGLERRVLAALDASPSRIPVILGGCGSGRTQLLHRLRAHLGRASCQYLDIERTATTPERFLTALTAVSPFRTPAPAQPTTREAFTAALAFLDLTRGPASEGVTFLVDEVLELRTFESFPGLRHSLRELIDRLAASGNRFVLTSRYVTRTLRLLREATSRFEVIHVPALSAEETRAFLPARVASHGAEVDLEDQAQVVHALADGRPSYVHAWADELVAMHDREGICDPIGALSALLSPEGRLDTLCRFSYELRLHRARGYGALKAILEILAQDEPLTLTAIARRLRRTPGSTKDYLSWLEDVDLVTVRQKRYSFTDPLLRLWVRLYCRALPPSDEELAREVHAYALARLPQVEPELALAAQVGHPDDHKNWGIIEID